MDLNINVAHVSEWSETLAYTTTLQTLYANCSGHEHALLLWSLRTVGQQSQDTHTGVATYLRHTATGTTRAVLLSVTPLAVKIVTLLRPISTSRGMWATTGDRQEASGEYTSLSYATTYQCKRVWKTLMSYVHNKNNLVKIAQEWTPPTLASFPGPPSFLLLAVQKSRASLVCFHTWALCNVRGAGLDYSDMRPSYFNFLNPSQAP